MNRLSALPPKAVGALLLLAVVAGLGGWHKITNRATRIPTAVGAVVEVVDGDTIKVQGVGAVRVLLVDAPETRSNSHAAKGCYGETAKAFVSQLLPVGTPVNLVPDRQLRDKYGRLLAYVEAGGVDVGRELLRRGYGEVLYYKPNDARLDDYLAVEAEAERLELGIWGSACAP